MIHDWNEDIDDLEESVRQAADDITNRSISHSRFKYDALVVPGDLSGVVMGAPLALALRKPLVIVRLHANQCARHSKHIIGEVAGKRLLYVDDQISSGKTFSAVRDAVVAHGGQVDHSYEYQFREFH